MFKSSRLFQVVLRATCLMIGSLSLTSVFAAEDSKYLAGFYGTYHIVKFNCPRDSQLRLCENAVQVRIEKFGVDLDENDGKHYGIAPMGYNISNSTYRAVTDGVLGSSCRYQSWERQNIADPFILRQHSTLVHLPGGLVQFEHRIRQTAGEDLVIAEQLLLKKAN